MHVLVAPTRRPLLHPRRHPDRTVSVLVARVALAYARPRRSLPSAEGSRVLFPRVNLA